MTSPDRVSWCAVRRATRRSGGRRGLARETLVFAFAAVAYNVHMLRSWEAQEAIKGEPVDDLPPRTMTETVPNSTAVTDRQDARRSKRAQGPKGLEALGHSPPPLLA